MCVEPPTLGRERLSDRWLRVLREGGAPTGSGDDVSANRVAAGGDSTCVLRCVCPIVVCLGYDMEMAVSGR